MTTLGIFNTSNFNPNLLKKSFAKTVLTKMPNGSAPLLGFSAMLKNEPISSFIHSWYSKSMMFPKATITVSVAATAPGAQSQITVADNSEFVPGSVLDVTTTGEQMLVVSLVGTTGIWVRRGQGVSPASAIAAGTVVHQIGNAHEEASKRPIGKTYNGTTLSNITQIFRNTWSVSGTAAVIDNEIGTGRSSENFRECGAFHAQDIEMALLFGEKHATAHNGQPLRKMDGIRSMIHQYSGNVFTAASTTTFDQLSDMLNPMVATATDIYNSNERVIFTGNKGLRVLNKFGRLSGVTQIMDGQTSFGMRFTTFMTDLGTFRIVNHPLFNTRADMANALMVVDTAGMNLHYLRTTKHKKFNSSLESEQDAADDGIDGAGGTLTTELTMSVANPAANGIVYGLCEAVAPVAVTAPQTYIACVSINTDTPSAGGAFTLTITGSKPSTPVPVILPTGTAANVTIDAVGTGTLVITAPTNPGQYAMYINSNATLSSVSFKNPTQFISIGGTQPATVISNSAEPDSCSNVTAANSTAMDGGSPAVGAVMPT